MNIAILTPAWPAGAVPNGIASYYQNLAPAMAALGHKIIILTFHHDSTQDSGTENVHVYEIPKKLGRLTSWFVNAVDKFKPGYLVKQYGSLQIIRALENALEDHQIDIMQMEESFAWHANVRNRFSFPVVARLHGPHFLNSSQDMGGAQNNSDIYRITQEGKALSQASAITAPSHDVMSQTKKYYKANWQHAAVFPNPIQMDETKPVWSLQTCDRNEILFVGRFDQHKGADILLEAFELVADDLPDVTLTFAGPDPGIVNEAGDRRFIDDYLNKLPQNIKDRVTYLGKMNRSDVPSLRQRAFMTVVSSRYETFGNVVLEAMACGTPLIATNTGGIAEIVEAEKTGILVEPGNAQILATSLKNAFSDPVGMAQLGAQSYKTVKERFDPEKIAADHLHFFETVIAANNP